MIRLATIADLEPLAYMAWALDRDHVARGEPSVLDALTIGLDHAFATGQPVMVSEQGGKLVGFCLWVNLPGQKPNEATCFGTYIEPDHRGHGLSLALRNEATKDHIERGVTTFNGSVVLGNHAGLESALADGFRVTGLLVRKEVDNGQGKQGVEGREERERQELRAEQLLTHTELTDRGRL